MFEFAFLILALSVAFITAVHVWFVIDVDKQAHSVYESLGRPGFLFFLVGGGLSTRHPYVQFLIKRHYEELLQGQQALINRARILRTTYLVTTFAWMAAILLAVMGFLRD